MIPSRSCNHDATKVSSSSARRVPPTMATKIALLLLFASGGDDCASLLPGVHSFRYAALTSSRIRTPSSSSYFPVGLRQTTAAAASSSRRAAFNADNDGDDRGDTSAAERREDRRTFLGRSVASAAGVLGAGIVGTVGSFVAPESADAAVGSIAEFSDANAVLQGITIDVADQPQYEETIEFFTKSFDGMKVLRQRGGEGTVRDTWLGFGPETFSVPSDFTFPVSSLAAYGGHASLRIRFDPNAPSALYTKSNTEYNEAPASGDSIAYLQLGVPQYKISQMQVRGGNILDAFGWVNVVSPAGLPVRSIVGIRPDPMMFLAVNCADVVQSEEFYSKLGFVRQEFPYARPNQGKGQFEPPQPRKSVYLAPSKNSMGVLLLQNKNRKKAVNPNPVLRSLNIVYTPSEGEASDAGKVAMARAADVAVATDPSGVGVTFVPTDYFESQLK